MFSGCSAAVVISLILNAGAVPIHAEYESGDAIVGAEIIVKQNVRGDGKDKILCRGKTDGKGNFFADAAIVAAAFGKSVRIQVIVGRINRESAYPIAFPIVVKVPVPWVIGLRGIWPKEVPADLGPDSFSILNGAWEEWGKDLSSLVT